MSETWCEKTDIDKKFSSRKKWYEQKIIKSVRTNNFYKFKTLKNIPIKYYSTFFGRLSRQMAHYLGHVNVN